MTICVLDIYATAYTILYTQRVQLTIMYVYVQKKEKNKIQIK